MGITFPAKKRNVSLICSGFMKLFMLVRNLKPYGWLVTYRPAIMAFFHILEVPDIHIHFFVLELSHHPHTILVQAA